MTTKSAHLYTERKHDAVLFFDVSDGNPNGDPDAGNLPRVDPETMEGLVTDVSIKRKVRNWIDASRGNEERFKIYVQTEHALNTLHQRAYTHLGIKSTGSKQKREEIASVRDWMCQNFFDIRTFGAVMTTGVNAGQVRGPVQLTFARSIHPIVPLDISITRTAVTKPEDMKVAAEEGEEGKGKTSEMGRKPFVPYGLYRAHIFVNPHFAAQTGFDNDDLAIFWEALGRMWDLDRSASRGLMACRGLFVFSHESPLGNAPAHRLFERVTAHLIDEKKPPRRFTDYKIDFDDNDLPPGVSVTQVAC